MFGRWIETRCTPVFHDQVSNPVGKAGFVVSVSWKFDSKRVGRARKIISLVIISDSAIGGSATARQLIVNQQNQWSNIQDNKITKPRKPRPGGSNLIYIRHQN